MDFLLDGLPQEFRDQLAALGLNLNDLDPDVIEQFLESMIDTLPPEVVEALRELIATLRAAAAGGGGTQSAPPPPAQQEEEEGPIRKNTPGGPVTIPGTG
jgi:hypothetical protein